MYTYVTIVYILYIQTKNLELESQVTNEVLKSNYSNSITFVHVEVISVYSVHFRKHFCSYRVNCSYA